MSKKKTFENSLTELEDIIKSLEKGDQSLEASLKQFEKGIELARFCQKQLTDAEQKIETIMQKDMQNDLETDSK